MPCDPGNSLNASAISALTTITRITPDVLRASKRAISSTETDDDFASSTMTSTLPPSSLPTPL